MLCETLKMLHLCFSPAQEPSSTLSPCSCSIQPPPQLLLTTMSGNSLLLQVRVTRARGVLIRVFPRLFLHGTEAQSQGIKGSLGFDQRGHWPRCGRSHSAFGSPGQRPRNPVGRRGGPRPRDPPPARSLGHRCDPGTSAAARTLRAQQRRRGELEARDEPGTRAGRPEPGRGGSCADPGPHSLPVGPRTRGGSLRDTVDGGGVWPPSPAGQMWIPWVWATNCADLLAGETSSFPGTRARGLPTGPAAVSAVTRRGAGGPRHGRGRSGRLSGPPLRARLSRTRASSGSRSGPESRPDARGLLPANARPARPTHRGSASPHPPLGPRLPRASRRAGRPPPTLGRSASPGAGQPGRLWRAASPAESAALGRPARLPRACAARTRLGGLGAAGKMPAPEREWGGGDGNRGEQERA